MKKAAVVLCGSGFKDGSEIRESVAVLFALSEMGVEASCFALDENQFDVVNCLTLENVPNENRNQLVESARIARGEVKPLSQLETKDFDILVIPGGFGAAKNLCNFSSKGSVGEVNPTLKEKLLDFYQQKKPIGAVCIAPAILALAFKDKSIDITLGGESGAVEEILKLGHTHIPKKAFEWHVSEVHRMVTTPAYMHDKAPLHEIFMGIRGMVIELVKLAK